MIVMTKKLQELLDELKKTNAETFYHGIHVKALTNKMIMLMNNGGFTDYTPKETDWICKGALLHDIGKLYVKNVILTKFSALSKEEMAEMTEHTRLGFEAVKDELHEDEYEIIKNICLYHHERIDGSGYEGKKEIPLYVQIVSACDVFDALHSDRIYRKGLPYSDTMNIIGSGGSGYFDSRLLGYLKQATYEFSE